MKDRKYLNIDNCILIHDLKQVQKEPAEKKIKTKNQLSKLIFKSKKIEGTKISIYTKLSRYEKIGFFKEDKELITAILSHLEVTRKELIKEL